MQLESLALNCVIIRLMKAMDERRSLAGKLGQNRMNLAKN